jgi:hypothetical protein
MLGPGLAAASKLVVLAKCGAQYGQSFGPVGAKLMWELAFVFVPFRIPRLLLPTPLRFDWLMPDSFDLRGETKGLQLVALLCVDRRLPNRGRDLPSVFVRLATNLHRRNRLHSFQRQLGAVAVSCLPELAPAPFRR